MEAGRAWLVKGEPLEKQDQVVHMSFLLLKEVQMKGTLKYSKSGLFSPWSSLCKGNLLNLSRGK